MYNDNKQKFTRLTLEQPNGKFIWEIPYDDPNGNDMMQAITTIMIGMTFSEKSVYESMAEYLIDKAYDMYEINNIKGEKYYE